MPPAIDVTDLQVTPNDCPLGKERLSCVKISIGLVESCAHLGDSLKINLSFVSNEPMQQVYWEVCCGCLAVQHIVECGAKRPQRVHSCR